MTRTLLTLALIAAALPGGAQPTPPEEGGKIRSLGQPPILRGNGFLSAGTYSEGESNALTGYLTLGIDKPWSNPAVAALYFGLEGYAGAREEELDGGARASVYIPLIRLAFGYDFNFLDEKGDFVLSLIHPIRRGGLFGGGSQLRVDWLPGRGHSLNFGVTFPLGVPNQGRTRTRADKVRLPRPDMPRVVVPPGEAPEVREALAHVTEAARWISLTTTPYLDQDAGDREKAIGRTRAYLSRLKQHIARTGPLGEGRSALEDERIYHRELERAFSAAAGASGLGPGESTPTGRRLADAARQALFEEVLIPYDRLLGRKKTRDSALAFAGPAREAFGRAIASVELLPERRTAVADVFDRLLLIVEATRKQARAEWENDSRLVWLPLQLGLTADQYDTRPEIDAIVERVVGASFVGGNRVWYVPNEGFAREVGRMVQEAESYHVLWLHDFRGVDGAGDPDEVTYLAVKDAYLRTLTRRVSEYDETGKLPIYIIIQDQMFYELNKSRRLLKVLESPLERDAPSFPEGYGYMQEGLDEALRELRAAVASSKRLQEEAGRFGDDWLRNRVKVHINVSHPADPTYWSQQIIPIVGVLDVMIRDHRKISFYDITEDDPYAGMGIYSGMGIGEHYTGGTWEDRALMVQGPAMLSLREEARRVLLQQGFAPEEIPEPLKPKPMPEDYWDRVQRRIETQEAPGRVLDLHNVNGFGPKRFSVFKAVAYSLMPPGSVKVVPDHLWNNPFWGGLLAGSALRGSRAFVISPSLAAHPGGASAPVASRTQELFERLILFQQELGPEIEAAGGLLKTGFYDVKLDVKNIPGRARLALEGIRDTPFLRRLFAFDESVYGLEEYLDDLARDYAPRHLFGDAVPRPPTLHLKINYLATPEGWSIASHPRMRSVLEAFIGQRLRVVEDPTHYVNAQEAADAIRGVTRPVIEDFLAGFTPDEREHAAAYLTVGSHNQDYRAMILDGEVGATLSGLGALVALPDVFFLMGSATWVDTLEELEPMYPAYGEFTRSLGRFIRTAI